MPLLQKVFFLPREQYAKVVCLREYFKCLSKLFENIRAQWSNVNNSTRFYASTSLFLGQYNLNHSALNRY